MATRRSANTCRDPDTLSTEKKVFRILKENTLLNHTYNYRSHPRRVEFSSFKDADNTITMFISFYNNERLHSAIDYRTPGEVYEKWKEKIIEGSA